MKFRALLVVAGACCLAGCGSHPAAGKPRRTAIVSVASTPRPTAVVRVASTPRPRATVAPAHTAATRTAVPPTAVPIPAHVHISGSAYKQGRTYLAKRKYADAVAAFRMAIKRGDNSAAAQIGLGQAELAMGQPGPAYAAYRKAASVPHPNPLALYGAAYSALQQRNYHAALAYATRYISAVPKDSRGYHVRFLANGGLLRGKPQLADARQEVKLAPHSAAAYNDLGIALANRNEYGPAVVAFTHAIKLNGTVADYYSNRAIVESLERKPKPALLDLEKARSLTHDASLASNLDKAIAALKKRLHG